jgi:hypothetical protein
MENTFLANGPDFRIKPKNRVTISPGQRRRHWLALPMVALVGGLSRKYAHGRLSVSPL